jgi:apolipoprotein N-acyltransferase
LWSELAYHGPPVDSSRPQQDALAGTLPPLDKPIDVQETGSEKALEELCRRFGVPLVAGYTRTDDVGTTHRKYNSAAFVDPVDGLQGSYDKVGLVPWTEFTPLKGLSTRKGSEFNHGSSCPVFTLRSAATETSYRFATAICFDVAFPQLFRRWMHAAEGAPDFFLVCSSERSDKTGRMSRHALTMARVRAIECRRTLVRNVHLGHSGIIDSTGRLREHSIPLSLESPTPIGKIPIDQRSTLYILWGDWISSAIICVVLIAAVLKVSRRASPSRAASDRDLQKSMGC